MVFGRSHAELVAAAQFQRQLQQLSRGLRCAPRPHMPRGFIQRRHRLAWAGRGGKVTGPFFWIDDDRAHLPVHLAPVRASRTGIDTVCEQRMSEPHPGTVECDEVTVLSDAEKTPHVWSEQALEQVQRRIRQNRHG